MSCYRDILDSVGFDQLDQDWVQQGTDYKYRFPCSVFSLLQVERNWVSNFDFSSKSGIARISIWKRLGNLARRVEYSNVSKFDGETLR